jgi:sugar (glycoside-pentoside-hexuronide) transporter
MTNETTLSETSEIAVDINKKYLKKKDYIWFSLGLFSSSSIQGLVQGYLLFFYTAVMGINPISVGAMFLFVQIFDGITDPIMGTIIDKTRTKLGKMRPYIIYGAIPYGIMIVILFTNFNFSSHTSMVVFMYITYFTYELISTIPGVPLQGIPTVASPNDMERTKLVSVSRIVGSIADSSGLVLFSLFILFFRNEGNALFVSALVMGIIGPILMIMAGLTVKERLKPTKEIPKAKDTIRYLVKNKPFLMLVLSNFLTFFRNFVTSVILFVVVYIYNDGGLQIAFALPGAIAGAIGMLITPYLKKRMNAKKIFIVSILWHSAALAIVYFIAMITGWWETTWFAISVMMFFAMMPIGILNLVPHLMAMDTLDYWEHKTGMRQEGACFALMGLRSKVSSAFRNFVLTLFLAFFLFSQPINIINSHQPIQSQFTRQGLFMLYTIIPAVLTLVAIIPIMFYDLTGDKIKKIREELAVRRVAEGMIIED